MRWGLLLTLATAVSGCGRIAYDPLPAGGDVDGTVVDVDGSLARDGSAGADGSTSMDGGSGTDAAGGSDGSIPGEDGSIATDAGGSTVVVGETPGADFSGVTTDTVLNSSFTTLNYGASTAMNLRSDTISQFVGLMRFDLSSLPSGTIAGAELRVTTTTTVIDRGRVDLYRVLEEWQEGDQNGGSGVANADDRLPGVAWTAASAGPGSRDSVVVGTFTPRDTSTEYVVTLDAAVVQGWLDSPESNFGLALVAAGHRMGDAVQIATSEASSGQPHLVVSY